jgi:hypothetical protein
VAPRTTPPGRLAVSVPSEAYLRAADREQLELDRAELYIHAAAVDEVGPEAGFGLQAVFWLRGPWGTSERVLALSLNGYRRRQVANVRDALRRSARVGPFLLTRRTAESGHAVWTLIPAPDAAEQLALEETGNVCSKRSPSRETSRSSIVTMSAESSGFRRSCATFRRRSIIASHLLWR